MEKAVIRNPSSTRALHLNPRKIFLAIQLCILLLALVSLAGQALKYLTVYDQAFGLIPLVDFYRSLSIPTVFNYLLYFLIVLLVETISKLRRAEEQADHQLWAFLAIVFIYITLQRGSGLHNYLILPLRRLLRAQFPGLPKTNLIITASFITLVLIPLFSKLIKSLPRRSLYLGLSAVALHLLGFLGYEFFGTAYARDFGKDNLTFSLIFTLTRTLQMSGVGLGIFALLDYLEKEFFELAIQW